ncbi:hypothetical protein SG586P1_00019 [Streptococcus phage SG586P1]|nr:hypothetical protein SG586P1_00019 [Streptococcus phage SG586P1]WAX18024.1 hypothetical protein SG586P3_00019 [Streptococcus phage SG586P3]
MIINIHDKDLNIIGVIDNDSQKTVHYDDDTLTEDLKTGSAVYEFTALKNVVSSSETTQINPFDSLVVGNWVSFKLNGNQYLLKIVETERSWDEVYVYAEDLILELRSENTAPFSTEDEKTIEEYIEDMKLLSYTGMSVRINEAGTMRKALEFSNAETKLSRLLALFSEFGVEHEFNLELKPNGHVKNFYVDIRLPYNNSTNEGGVGDYISNRILKEGKEIKTISEKENILEIYNRTRPIGKNTIERVTISDAKSAVVAQNAVTVSSNMINANGTLSIENIQTILKLCYEYRLLPSGVISQLYLESFWGNSNVARVDNNWSGMTWTGNGNRPSGVVVTQGSSRPANEGGYYMHFANMSDFFKDYFYLLAKQGIYNVANKNNISEYTKGLFRVGGATYDYAAAGYDHYNSLMTSIRNGINGNNSNVLDTYDNQWLNPTVVTSTTVEVAGASSTKSALNELAGLLGNTIGNGQCYGATAWYSYKLGGAGLNGGVGGFAGLIGSGVKASEIGTDYNWAGYGWGVKLTNITSSDIISGAILNIKANYGSPWYTGYYGHTLIVESTNGDTVTVLQQNANGRQYLTRDNYSISQIVGSIQSIVLSPELTAGGRVEGGNKVVKENVTERYVEVELPNEVETTEETLDIYISEDTFREYFDDNGALEFRVRDGFIDAVKSANLYPPAFSSKEGGDRWIRRDFEYVVTSEDDLIEKALADLKEACYPALEFEIDGYFDGKIGDTFLIESDKFTPQLNLKARIIKKETSTARPENSKTTFSNFIKLKSKVSDSLQQRLEAIVDSKTPYTIRITATAGTSFKNNTGSSTITPQLLRNGIEKEGSFIYKVGDSIIGKGESLTVNATDFEDIWSVTVEAYVNGELVSSYPLTFTDTVDGEAGADGVGVDSTVINYASSSSPTNVPNNWTESIPTVSAGNYLWTRTVWNYTDSTVKTGYSVAKMGENGEAGKTTYPHWAYADNSTGTQGFSLTDGTNKQYQGFYSDFNQTASTDPTKYTWVDRTANVQVSGVNLYALSSNQKIYKSNVSSATLDVNTGNVTLVPNGTEPLIGRVVVIGTTYSEIYGIKIPVVANRDILVNFTNATFTGNYVSYFGSNNVAVKAPTSHPSNSFKISKSQLSGVSYITICFGFVGSTSIIGQKFTTKIKVEYGTVPTDWSEAPEDTQEKLNNKADSDFTTEQLNALQEQQQLQSKELEAKALQSDLEKWYEEYTNYVTLNDSDKENSEQELITLSARIVAQTNDLADTKERWNFLDNYMEAGEEGLVIGQKDGSAQFKVTNDRISLLTNGQEVMWISQNTLYIENGIFTTTLQIGNFRFESFGDSDEFLVIRFLGVN